MVDVAPSRASIGYERGGLSVGYSVERGHKPAFGLRFVKRIK